MQLGKKETCREICCLHSRRIWEKCVSRKGHVFMIPKVKRCSEVNKLLELY